MASELESQLAELKPNHRRMLSEMKKMPSYLRKGNLSEWEADYRNAIGEEEDEESFNYRAIDLLYELAGLNLFRAYNVAETVRMYSWVVEKLQQQGIKVTENLDVSEY